MHRRYNKLPVHVYIYTQYVEKGIDNESKKK